MRGLGRERPLENGLQCVWYARPVNGIAREQRLPAAAGERFVEHHAHGVQIGLGRDLPPEGLFRRHVPGRAGDGEGAQRRDGLRSRGGGDAEVGQQGAVLSKEDVARLDVAVHDARRMDRFQGGQHVAPELDRIAAREGPTFQALRQGRSLNEVHHVVEEALGLTRPVDAHGVGVMQAGEDPRFFEEPLGGCCRRHLGADDLDGNHAV
jgi:hypothetical protein